MNNRKNLIFALLFSILLLVSFVIIKGSYYYNDRGVTEKIDSNEEDIDVKKVAEDFIKNNFSYLYSSSDYSLVDSDSKVFLRYLELRNRYRETTLKEAGETSDKYTDIKNEYKYKGIRYIENDFVKMNVDVTTSFRYKKDREISSLELPYELYLIKKIMHGKYGLQNVRIVSQILLIIGKK